MSIFRVLVTLLGDDDGAHLADPRLDVAGERRRDVEVAQRPQVSAQSNAGVLPDLFGVSHLLAREGEQILANLLAKNQSTFTNLVHVAHNFLPSCPCGTSSCRVASHEAMPDTQC